MNETMPFSSKQNMDNFDISPGSPHPHVLDI